MMASVGPLEVPGRSKYARTSAARFLRVRPRLMSSVSAAGTLWLTDSISFCISSRPRTRSGSR